MSGLDLLIPQSALWYMLLVAVLIGALLGVLCDGLFVIRLLLLDPEACGAPRRSVAYAILRGVCDCLSAILATVLLMLLCYYTSDGQLRAPAILGMIVGFWAYRKTVSRLIRRLLTAVIGWLQRGLRSVWTHTLGRLVRAVYTVVTRCCRETAERHRARKEEKKKQKDADDALGVES